MPAWALDDCARCGAPLGHKTTGRPRRFCCDVCKQAAHRVTKVNRKGYSESQGKITHGHNPVPGLGKPGKPGRMLTT